MKLKLLILLSLMFSLQAFSAVKSASESIDLMQVYLDKNQPEKVEDLFDDNEETLNKSELALTKLAISFERREKIKEAIDIYRKIIVGFGKETHEKILSTPISKIDISTQNITKFQFYYYKLAYLNSQLFIKSSSYTPEQERSKYKKNAEGFIALARKVRTDESELKSIEDLLQEKIQKDTGLSYKSRWYISADFISWQDRLYLVSASGEKTGFISTAKGPCLGLGRKWENINYEFDFEGCMAMTKASVQLEDKTSKYQQSGISVSGLVIGPGIYFKTFSDNVFLGVQLPVKYRKGDWTNPDASQFRVEKMQSIEAGYLLQSKIKIKKFFLRTRFGKIFPNPGSTWSIGVLYDF